MRIKNTIYKNPIGALIEITSQCNLKCKHCYNTTDSRTIYKDMSNEQYMQLIDSLLKKGVFSITLTGGEPLLNKELLFSIFELVKHYSDTSITIVTNGYYLDEKFLNKMNVLPNHKNIQISIDGSRDYLHDEVRGVGGSWKKAIDSCIAVGNSNINLLVAHTINKLNFPYYAEMFDLCKILGVKSLGIGSALPIGNGLKNEDLLLDFKTREELYSELKRCAERYNDYYNTNIITPGGRYNYSLYKNFYQDWFVVASNGNVKIDGRLPFYVGNVNENSINELWDRLNTIQSSSSFLEIIKNRLLNDIEIDNNLDMYLDFNDFD